MARPVNSIKNIRANSIRDEESGCLLYTKALDRDGYPKISYQGKKRLGSHIVFELSHGVIPEGHEVDHICHVRRCVEPTHLRALTHQENVIHIKAYMEKREQRIKHLLDAYPQVTFFPVLLTLPELQVLWECKNTGNVKALLRTMSNAFPNEFFYERFEAGQGRHPDLYAVGIQPSLIDKLSNKDEQGETPAEDIMTLVA
jgi:HNH endonuclease